MQTMVRARPRIGAELIVVVRSANQRWFAEQTTTICDSYFCADPKTNVRATFSL